MYDRSNSPAPRQICQMPDSRGRGGCQMPVVCPPGGGFWCYKLIGALHWFPDWIYNCAEIKQKTHIHRTCTRRPESHHLGKSWFRPQTPFGINNNKQQINKTFNLFVCLFPVWFLGSIGRVFLVRKRCTCTGNCHWLSLKTDVICRKTFINVSAVCSLFSRLPAVANLSCYK